MKKLKIHTLSKGWHEPDERLLHAAFQVLVDWMEKENSDNISWSEDSRHLRAWHEMKSLYKWWTKLYPLAQKEIYGKDNTYANEEILRREIQENLHRLINIREYMWT